jgi:hypothetical protein
VDGRDDDVHPRRGNRVVQVRVLHLGHGFLEQDVDLFAGGWEVDLVAGDAVGHPHLSIGTELAGTLRKRNHHSNASRLPTTIADSAHLRRSFVSVASLR